MASGPHHYREAEKLLRAAAHASGANPAYAAELLAAAQVNATLAVAAATAAQLVEEFIELEDDAFAWNEATGTAPRGMEDVYLPGDLPVGTGA